MPLKLIIVYCSAIDKILDKFLPSRVSKTNDTVIMELGGGYHMTVNCGLLYDWVFEEKDVHQLQFFTRHEACNPEECDGITEECKSGTFFCHCLTIRRIIIYYMAIFFLTLNCFKCKAHF
jgi:hypothetical protein